MMRHVKRSIVITTGCCVVLLGLILMPVPGPGGTPVFLAGLAILATECKWARDFLVRFKDSYARMGKTKRRILTVSALVFYAVSGYLVWNWAGRQGS